MTESRRGSRLLLKPYVPFNRPESQAKTSSAGVAPPLEISPERIVFKDVLVTQTYSHALVIRNMTTESRKVRVFHSLSQNFLVQYDQKMTFLAAGLSLTITIVFDAKLENMQEFTHELRIVSQDFEKVVEILALRPQMQVECTNLLDFGKVEVGSRTTKHLCITNKSKSKVTVNLHPDDWTALRIASPRITLKEGQSSNVPVEYAPEAAGLLKCRLQLEIEESVRNSRNVQLLGAAFVCSYFFTDCSGVRVERISFSNYYVGQKFSQHYKFVNNTAQRITARFSSAAHNSHAKDRALIDSTNILSPRRYAKEQEERFLVCSPIQADLEPFAEVALTLTAFQKPTPQQLRQFQLRAEDKLPQKGDLLCSEKCIFAIELLHDGRNVETLRYPVASDAQLPNLAISESCFNFGSSGQLKQTSSIMLQLRNRELLSLLVRFELEEGSHYQVKGGSHLKLTAKETREVEVIYAPKSAGVHAEEIKLVACDFYEFRMRAFGETRRPTISMHSTARQSFSQLPKESAAAKKPEIKRRIKNFSSYVPAKGSTQALNKRKLEEALQETDEPVDIEFRAGILVSPRERMVRLPNLTDPLYQDNTFKEKQLNKLQPRINPCTTRNKQEQADVERSLTADELKAIVVSDTHLDFGVMFVATVGRKSFMVRNNTGASVHVAVFASEPRIEVAPPHQQVIPTGQCGSFELTLGSRAPTSYKALTKYVINGKHSFELMLFGTFIPIGLEPSQKEVHIAIDERDSSFSKAESILLRNNGNKPVSFSFGSIPKFEAVPREGQIPPQSNLEVKVVYTPVCENTEPQGVAADEGRLCCFVEGGLDTYISCTGTVREAKCIIKQQEINLGELPVSMVTRSRLTVKNLSRLATVFKIELLPETLGYYLSFKKEVLSIKPEAKQEIEFKFCCQTDRMVRGEIILHFRGYRRVSVPFSAKSTVPRLVIEEEHLNYGEVACGNIAPLTFHLRNNSDVNGVVEVPLETSELGIIDLSTNQKNRMYLRTRKAVVALTEHEHHNAQSSREILGEDEDESQTEKDVHPTYLLTIPPRHNIPVRLVLQPNKNGEFEHSLPVLLVGQNEVPEGISRKIKMTVVPSCVHVSTQTVDFKRCVVSETNEWRSVTIEVANLTTRAVSWTIENASPTKEFKLVPQAGTISERGNVKLTASFRPEQADEFETVYFLKVNGGGRTAIQLIGLGVLPTLLFDRREIILTPVPLGIRSLLTMFVLNDGYESVKVERWKLQEEIEGVELTFDFFEGRTLSVIKQRLGLNISFKSREPISFTTTLHLFDSNNERYSISISATADNSIFTNYSYLETCEGRYSISEEQGVSLLEVGSEYPTKKKLSTTNYSTSFRRELQFNFFRVPALHVTNRTCSHITRWMRYFVSDKIDSFPESCLRLNGQPIYDMLSKLAGEAYLESNSVSEKASERPKTMEPQYANLLRRLKEEGCFLNHIRPEYLLSLDDYLTFTNNSDNKYSLTPSQAQLYEQVNAESWCALFFQICKVYIINRPMKSLKALLEAFPVAASTANLDKPKDSNVLTVQESRLLNFFKNFTGAQLQLTDSCRTKLLTAVIDRVVGSSMSTRLSPMNSPSLVRTSLQDALCGDLALMLADFGIGMYLNQEDIITLSHKQTILFLYHLSQQLEHLIPRQTVLFRCSLGERPQKSAQLRNPSDSPVVYWPKLLGSSDFEVQQDLPIHLGPKQSVDYNIRYVSRFNKPSSARLFFVEKTSESQPQTKATPFVLRLQSEVVGKSVIRHIDFETHQYQLFTVVVDVQCPFVVSSRHSLQLTVTLLEDSKKKPSCFFLMQNKVRILKNKEAKLQLKFLSFQAEKRSCKLSFFGEVNGEFIYELRANVLEPRPLANITFPAVEVRSAENVMVQLPASNEPYEKAVKLYLQYWKTRPKMSELSYVPSAFKCELLDSYGGIVLPDSVPHDGDDQPTIPLHLQLEFKRPYKSFSFRVLLALTPSNVRVYQLTTRVKPKPVVIKLAMETSARNEISQSLPIQLFPSRATLLDEHPELFLLTQLREFDADCQIDKLIVVFKPNWVCQFVTRLMIEQTQTLEQIVYEIEAKATEPSPEEVIEVVMQNRRRYSRLLEVKAVQGQTFTASSDLPFCQVRASAPSLSPSRSGSTRNFSFAAKLQTFEIELLPNAVGCFEGVVRFQRTLTQQYVWYKLKVQVLENQSSGEIEVSAVAGTSRTFSLPKFSDYVGACFSVTLDAPYLTGEDTFNVEDANNTYSVTFHPLKEFKHTGRLTFFDARRNEEVWYSLRMVAERSKLVCHPQSRIGFGLRKTIQLSIDNPSKASVCYHISNSNRQHFVVEESIHLEPKSTAVLNVVCTSSVVNEVQEAVLVLTSDSLFTREHRLSTLTIPQERPELISFKSEIGMPSKQILVFHNPTREQCLLSFEFVEDNGFELLTKEGYSSKPRSMTIRSEPTILNLCFTPKARTPYSNDFIVTVNGRFSWHYKLSGVVVETLKKLPDLTFSTRCRNPLTRLAEFELADDDPITNIEVAKDYQQIFKFRIIAQEKGRLSLQITFAPFKPIDRSMVCTVITSASGAIWRFDICAEALSPEPDDTLFIESSVGRCEQVCFRLTNKSKHPAPFTAYMSPDSAIEFSVEPPIGILEPYGKQGTAFYISFRPTLYQTRYAGLLIVETEEMYWSFKLMGRLPKYHPPNSPSGKTLSTVK